MSPRAVLLIIAFAVVALLSSGATAIYMWSRQYDDPDAPLLRGLPRGSWDDQNAAFRRRLISDVPLGSPETLLVSTLKAQGFTRSWGPADHQADLEWTTLVCGMGAHVNWQVDANDRVIQLQTRYHEEGCL
jgi:hypothetical protein